MSLDHHPGFDCGGTLWFQDLTESPYDLLCPIFPVLIAGLHYVNVQISFRMISHRKLDSIFDLLFQLYKRYLDFISFFLLFVGFFMPQGSLLYWVTNGSFSLIQQLSFKHPAVIATLGLPDTKALTTGNSEEMHTSDNLHVESSSKNCITAIEDLSPKELLKLSVMRLGKKQHEKAISSLKLALEKDPDYVRAMVVLGNTLMQEEMLVEAREYLEHAISKGGTLWFQDLTESPYDLLCPIFPVLIAGLHYVNVQISFRMISHRKLDSIFDLLFQLYKRYLDFISFFLLFVGFFMPQGSLLYWVTNGSFSLIQQLSFKHPAVIATLGLPDTKALTTGNSEEMHTSDNLHVESSSKNCITAIEDLSPKELLKLSVMRLGKKQHEKAISSLKLALEKDPDYVRAMVVLGNTLMQEEMLVEAREYLEHAISKLVLFGHPTNLEDIDLLILSSQWAAFVCIKQDDEAEGIVHLERIATLQEPADPQSKAHYYEGLLLLWRFEYQI
ncbi:hypothetical protein SLEP1_g54474 [Rubroshorea leprosula]|nr:hypothetical protein SLEP1_g54474 [Rubroshorea leprosula]